MPGIVPGSLGFVSVTTAGTPVQLSATEQICNFIRIQPRKNYNTVNAGNIYIMTGTAGGGAASNQGLIWAVLAPEQAQGILINPQGENVHNLANWWIDAVNSGDGVLVGYY